MKMISCRASFDANATFGPTMTQLTQVPPSAPTSVPKYGYSRSLTNFWILIHGYHTTVGAAEQSYAVIEQSLRPGGVGPDLAGYLWPGGDIAVDFPLAVIRARESAWRLADVLNGQSFTDSVNLQTHSLGARIALTVLASGAVNLGHVILSAPAVDYDSINTSGEFADAALHCRSLAIAFSRNDPVLLRDYPAGSFGHHALGCGGPLQDVQLPDNVRSVDFSRVINTHGGYRFCTEYYQLWKSVIVGDAPRGRSVI